jgi:hypothetical protein
LFFLLLDSSFTDTDIFLTWFYLFYQVLRLIIDFHLNYFYNEGLINMNWVMTMRQTFCTKSIKIHGFTISFIILFIGTVFMTSSVADRAISSSLSFRYSFFDYLILHSLKINFLTIIKFFFIFSDFVLKSL